LVSLAIKSPYTHSVSYPLDISDPFQVPVLINVYF
jgi:hypothetical protein